MDSHKFHMLRSNDGKNQEIWIKQEEWMHPKTIISEGSEMPFAVLRLLRKWSSEVNQIRTEFQSRARVGYAYVDFVYDMMMIIAPVITLVGLCNSMTIIVRF